MPTDDGKAEDAIPRGVQKRLEKLERRRHFAEFREEQAQSRIKELEGILKTKGSDHGSNAR